MVVNYENILNNVLADFPQKKKEIVVRRFGLQSGQPETLQAIGNDYGLTRERIRQITNDVIFAVKEKKRAQIEKPIRYFSDYLRQQGGLKKEEKLLEDLAGTKFRPHALFLLTIADNFQRIPETKEWHSAWAIEISYFEIAKNIIEETVAFLNKASQPMPLDKLRTSISLEVGEQAYVSYVEISKYIGQSDGLYGLYNWPEINPVGLREKAYVVLKKAGQPLHFTEIANLISQNFSKNALAESVHNELIKGDQFVLVGRGLYALKEWGYQPGTVQDIIVETLKQSKMPLSKEEVVEKVLAQRKVKPNTILINLQNRQLFQRDEQGRYTLKRS